MHLHNIRKKLTVTFGEILIFKPMEDGLDHVGRDAGDASIQLIADQDSAARSRIRGPPPDAVWRLLD